jgi:hypothetical protein
MITGGNLITHNFSPKNNEVFVQDGVTKPVVARWSQNVSLKWFMTLPK